MKRRTPLQSLQRPDRLQSRVQLTPKEIIALEELIQYNKAQFVKLKEIFNHAVHQYKTGRHGRYNCKHTYTTIGGGAPSSSNASCRSCV